MTTINIIIWACLALQLYLTATALIRHFKYSKDGLVWYREKLDVFTEQMLKDNKIYINEQIDEFKAKWTERADLLSKENSKLMEENEHLRDKLKNLGFTDISLKQ